VLSVFERLAPRYKRTVRRFALDVWENTATKKRQLQFLEEAEGFKRTYEFNLRKYYENADIKIYPGTIRAKADSWLYQQRALAESIRVIAGAKKNKLIAEEFDSLKEKQDGDVQKAIDRVYLSKKDIERGGQVFRVFAFDENFEAKAQQIGEESAFDLGREINEAVISQNGDEFGWETQHDRDVRATHRKLAGKNFKISDPPTTRDKYGREHTGLPGTDWGCRCYMVKPFLGKRILLHYLAAA
jgi:uncharacterized protein with gpF-like domain